MLCFVRTRLQTTKGTFFLVFNGTLDCHNMLTIAFIKKKNTTNLNILDSMLVIRKLLIIQVYSLKKCSEQGQYARKSEKQQTI